MKGQRVGDPALGVVDGAPAGDFAFSQKAPQNVLEGEAHNGVEVIESAENIAEMGIAVGKPVIAIEDDDADPKTVQSCNERVSSLARPHWHLLPHLTPDHMPQYTWGPKLTG